MIAPGRLLRTLRWLRPVQIWGRLWFGVYRPRVEVRPAPALRGHGASWRCCSRPPSMTGADTFRFLGIERAIVAPGDWVHHDWPKLWRYNLHYFDDLAADGADARRTWHDALVLRWIEENPAPLGDGWEPYPTSLRIVNWIKRALAGPAVDARVLDSLAVQVRWLRRRLEVHLLGNHLWANAKALVFAGVFFRGAEAALWLEKGLELIRRELVEQILADGGHFERSPMYHAIVLEDVLDLVQLAGVFPDAFAAAAIASWRETAVRMLRWLKVMSHPDGEIALFNDAAIGIARSVAALSAYAAQIGIVADAAPLATIEALPESGYVRLQAGAAVLIADVGKIGPDYLPGHAHADTLSFEFSLHGRRLFVNTGTSTYEAGPERLRQRGTAAHNTLMIDGEDSSEVWSSFRVGRRARPREVGYGRDDEQLQLTAAHDGYRRLAGRPVHRREWRLSSGALTVSDTVEGTCREAIARLRIDPSWTFSASSALAGAVANAAKPGSAMASWRTSGHAEIVPDTLHPAFATSVPCQLLQLRLMRSPLIFSLTWNP